jgi:nicotinamidase-related amidase
MGDRSVHLCIDMQRLFTGEGPWPTPSMPRVAPVIHAIVERAPEQTVFTRFIPPVTSDEAPGMWQAYYRKWESATRSALDPALLELVPALAHFAPPAKTIDKPVYSAFATGELHAWLREMHVNTLIVTGSETDICVLASVLAAVDLGYRVVVVKDGLCSSSDEAHDSTLNLFMRRFDLQIELADAARVLETWRL